MYDVVSLVMDTTAAIGLCLFAFSKSLLSRSFWKFFTAAYIVYCAAIWLIEVPKWLAEHNPSTSAAAFAIAFVSGLQFLTALGLWRHSTQPAQTIAAWPMAAIHVPPTGPALNMPIRASAHSDFPRVYRVADRSFYWAMTIILGTAAVYFSVVFGRDLLDPTKRAAAQAIAVHMTGLIIFLYLATFLAVAAVRSRLVLQDDAISLSGPFRTRSLRKEEIRGRRRLLKIKAGVLILEPAHAGVRPLAIRPKFETDAAFDAWLRDIRDLDAA
ncbi:hypothetical protein [Bradyrhizobium sp. AS23.2]|uniref:hypothetical protein n=1 Tax=Bradyrhizobium sp. AS23.2 TaxID=1680155 RepID=UPI00093B5A74|nr:hypothetical protein [Bradyrhizobium sp. AS23.2]OKO67601.1 hypothetical protein AC630_40135 [Bradyrhizobium sp. AS23.2]